MITITNLWKGFGENQVLKGLNLSIKKGEIMVIIGQSGSGKSVLLKLIIGLLKPDRGEINISGCDITKLSDVELQKVRLKFSMLFQEGALFDSMTVGENVGFFLLEHTNKPRHEIFKIVKEKLKIVGLEGVEDLSPSQLSGGMRKRVALARAIATSPEIILYDEPTTGIDPIMGASINHLIRELQSHMSLTSIAVTHDMKSAYQIGDRLAMLYDGKIIEVGTPKEIKSTQNPVVHQFITGAVHGPITDS
ncbi:MAG: ABC transporter ATP-binding protein [bacterium]|nr:ABC transporter ATP-binding protein [bacterium]